MIYIESGIWLQAASEISREIMHTRILSPATAGRPCKGLFTALRADIDEKCACSLYPRSDGKALEGVSDWVDCFTQSLGAVRGTN